MIFEIRKLKLYNKNKINKININVKDRACETVRFLGSYFQQFNNTFNSLTIIYEGIKQRYHSNSHFTNHTCTPYDGPLWKCVLIPTRCDVTPREPIL